MDSLDNRFSMACLHDIHEVVAYLEKKFSKEVLRGWTDDLAAKVFWYIKSCLCGITRDKAGQINSVVLGRPVMAIEDGSLKHWDMNWAGTILWVECAVSDCGLSAPFHGAIDFLRSVGCQFQLVAWCRLKKDGKLNVITFEKLNTLI